MALSLDFNMNKNQESGLKRNDENRSIALSLVFIENPHFHPLFIHPYYSYSGL
jgi:hypothetical protein